MISSKATPYKRKIDEIYESFTLPNLINQFILFHTIPLDSYINDFLKDVPESYEKLMRRILANPKDKLYLSEYIQKFLMNTKKLKPSEEVLLAIAYQYGFGVQIDLHIAFKLYHHAYKSKNVVAAYCLGSFYKNGWVVERNYAEAVKYLNYAVKEGNQSAILVLIHIYRLGGYGIQQNNWLADSYVKQIAENPSIEALDYSKKLISIKEENFLKYAIAYGSKEALVKLANIYSEKDEKDAVLLYETAVEQGDSCALQNLLTLYYRLKLSADYFKKLYNYAIYFAAKNESIGFYILGLYYDNSTNFRGDATKPELYKAAYQYYLASLKEEYFQVHNAKAKLKNLEENSKEIILHTESLFLIFFNCYSFPPDICRLIVSYYHIDNTDLEIKKSIERGIRIVRKEIITHKWNATECQTQITLIKNHKRWKKSVPLTEKLRWELTKDILNHKILFWQGLRQIKEIEKENPKLYLPSKTSPT